MNKVDSLIERYKENHILGPTGVLGYLEYEIQCGDGLAKIKEIQEFVNKLALIDSRYDLFVINNVNDVEILRQLIIDTKLRGIEGFEEIQKREAELIKQVNENIDKEILKKCFELGSKKIDECYVDSKRVPVTYKGKEIGYHQFGTMHFYNTEDAKEITDKFKDENLYISSRRIGELKEDNTVHLTGVNLTDTVIKEGVVWVPWKSVTVPENISRWSRFKMFLRRLFGKKSKYSTKKIINSKYSTIKIDKDGIR
jgi:hypothetical protein